MRWKRKDKNRNDFFYKFVRNVSLGNRQFLFHIIQCDVMILLLPSSSTISALHGTAPHPRSLSEVYGFLVQGEETERAVHIKRFLYFSSFLQSLFAFQLNQHKSRVNIKNKRISQKGMAGWMNDWLCSVITMV